MAERIMSIFFDESGDQGPATDHSPFYILSMVFHDQSHDISSQIQNFDDHMRLIELDVHAVHTGSLIRCEVPYRNWSLEDRKKLFSSFFNFMRKTSIKYDVILLSTTVVF